MASMPLTYLSPNITTLYRGGLAPAEVALAAIVRIQSSLCRAQQPGPTTPE